MPSRFNIYLCVLSHQNHSDPVDPADPARSPLLHIDPCANSSNSILPCSSHIIFHGTLLHERRRHNRVSSATFVSQSRIWHSAILTLVVGIVANHFTVITEPDSFQRYANSYSDASISPISATLLRSSNRIYSN